MYNPSFSRVPAVHQGADGERIYTHYVQFIQYCTACTLYNKWYIVLDQSPQKGEGGRNVSGEKRGLEGEEGNSQGGEKGFGRGKWKVKGKCVIKERRRMGRGK